MDVVPDWVIFMGKKRTTYDGAFTETGIPAEEGFVGPGDMRKDQIMCFMVNYLREKGYCPSIREIGKGVGLKSPSTVYTYMKELAKEGRIVLSEGANEPRAYRVAGYTFISEQELEHLRGAAAGIMDEEEVLP